MERKDKLDLLLKFLALLGAIFSFFWGIHSYKKVNEDDSAKAFWSQQFPIYKDLCVSVKLVSQHPDLPSDFSVETKVIFRDLFLRDGKYFYKLILDFFYNFIVLKKFFISIILIIFF